MKSRGNKENKLYTQSVDAQLMTAFAEINEAAQLTFYPDGREKHTKLQLNGKKAATLSLLASLAATGAATAGEALSGAEVPGLHVNVDLRYNVTVDNTLRRDPTVTTLGDGSRLYLPAFPDTINNDTLPLDTIELSQAATSMAFGLEITNGYQNEIGRMNAALDILQRPYEDIGHLTIESVIKQARTVTLSDAQVAELQSIASRRGVTSSKLIADYKNGALGDSKSDTASLERLLANNQNMAYDVVIKKDNTSIEAVLYEVGDEYTLVAERSTRTEGRGGQFPIVILPIPVPWLRRRTYYTYPTPQYKYTGLDSAYVVRPTTKDGREPIHGGTANSSSSSSTSQLSASSLLPSETIAVSGGLEALEMSATNPFLNGGGAGSGMLIGPRLENGAFYTQTPEKAEVPPVEPITNTELDPKEDASQPITAQEEVVEETTPIEEPAKPTDSEVSPEEAPVDNETTEDEQDEKDTEKKRRRIRLPLWLIIGVASASVVIPITIGVSQQPDPTTTPPPTPTPTDTSRPSVSPTPRPTASGTPRPLTAQEYIYNEINVHDITIAGQSLTTLNRKINELVTIGQPDTVHIFDRLDTVVQPEPPVAPEVTQVTLTPGQGGEALMIALGKNPSSWYGIAATLAAQYPNYFYVSGKDIRIARSGDVPSDVIASIKSLVQ
ncbi:MAG: hypothetical protein EOT05_01955 [Candidatus Microsaccharimonas sossegonensis]|uniref:Uncharacterized protein n=1 Tax=Candidatus Microsaccharimonas sossegonensis TaxID=2506948 RepID=A0A4Q0AIL8_9BACT|nr:MAG: hypothetical protein EOT05_01955 [Candidatus Microsaccharimonas sossegonensis]